MRGEIPLLNIIFEIMSQRGNYKSQLIETMEFDTIPSSLRLYGMRFKDLGLAKDKLFYETISTTIGYSGLKASIAERNLLRAILKTSLFKILLKLQYRQNIR
ncbi:hypothetical protein [Pedobacter zeae]|uniref:Uncharacterized protein n=1 Tax=Pedobacter zeae TaxID=1737356 RepID=A0A7W6K9K5_9SPHI|nr:hypothetical protein [Pedobacter zeae]MBB4107733.1 hypothetical protein [Pedobacter zeae]GGG97416.1 hypothetical protein GCM10007422_09210 [Pedobacter zeae]